MASETKLISGYCLQVIHSSLLARYADEESEGRSEVEAEIIVKALGFSIQHPYYFLIASSVYLILISTLFLKAVYYL